MVPWERERETVTFQWCKEKTKRESHYSKWMKEKRKKKKASSTIEPRGTHLINIRRPRKPIKCGRIFSPLQRRFNDTNLRQINMKMSASSIWCHRDSKLWSPAMNIGLSYLSFLIVEKLIVNSIRLLEYGCNVYLRSNSCLGLVSVLFCYLRPNEFLSWQQHISRQKQSLDEWSVGRQPAWRHHGHGPIPQNVSLHKLRSNFDHN